VADGIREKTECWSDVFELVEGASITITPVRHHSNTALLHYSSTPRVLAPDVVACSIPIRGSDLPIWIRHDSGDSGKGCILIDVT
jgi:hypothetical protein